MSNIGTKPQASVESITGMSPWAKSQEGKTPPKQPKDKARDFGALRGTYKTVMYKEKDGKLSQEEFDTFSNVKAVDAKTREKMTTEEYGYQVLNEKLAIDLKEFRQDKKLQKAEATVSARNRKDREDAELIRQERDGDETPANEATRLKKEKAGTSQDEKKEFHRQVDVELKATKEPVKKTLFEMTKEEIMAEGTKRGITSAEVMETAI